MRREVLYKAMSRIIDDINNCGMLAFFDSHLDQMRVTSDSKRAFVIPLDIFQKYMIAVQNYTDDEVEICRIMGIDKLLEVGYWEKLSEPDSGIQEMHAMMYNVRVTTTYLPKILSLTKQNYVQEIKDHQGELPEELKGKSLLAVLIVEDKGQYSRPIRLKNTLDAITNLYSVVATLEKESENDLIVLACDSGSDKSFDFLGLAKLVEQVKEIIIAIWDRMVFHRQRHVGLSIDLIAKSLPVLEKIDKLSEDGSIGKEQAELLKRKTIKGATQFIEAGATIPELDAESSHNPKQLMKPEPKLLASPWDEGSSNEKEDIKEQEGQENDGDDTDALSDEEKQTLELLLKKSKAKPKKKRVKRSKK